MKIHLRSKMCAILENLQFFYFSPSDPRHIPVFVTLLINKKNEDLRLRILNLMSAIITSNKVPEGNRSYWHLRHIGLSAVTKLLMDDVSEPLIKSLLRLGVSEHDENKGVDVLMHYHVVLAVLELIDNKDLETKLFVSHMVRTVFLCSREIFKVACNFS